MVDFAVNDWLGVTYSEFARISSRKGFCVKCNYPIPVMDNLCKIHQRVYHRWHNKQMKELKRITKRMIEMGYDTAVRCKKCGKIQYLEFKYGLKNGWSECCGKTMPIIKTIANIEKATKEALFSNLDITVIQFTPEERKKQAELTEKIIKKLNIASPIAPEIQLKGKLPKNVVTKELIRKQDYIKRQKRNGGKNEKN